jgi:2-dehydropantoate 2-reductase
MKILVLGAGATGGYFGGRLAQAAHLGRSDAQVEFLVRPARAEALRRDGLTVECPQGGFTIPVTTRLHTELKADYDLVLLSCKAYDLESSILAIYPALRPDTLILPILNGLAHFDRLDREFGARRVAGGCCSIGGQLTPAGVVRQLTDLQRINFGVRPGNDARAATRLDQLAAAYRATPVDLSYGGDVMQEIWEKFVMLASLGAMTCLMRAAVGDIVAAQGGAELMRAVYEECTAAARQAGHAPRPAAREGALAMLTAPGSAFTASMLRDLESGYRIEASHIVGDMLARARAAGHAAPLLGVAWVHLQARDARRAREGR